MTDVAGEGTSYEFDKDERADIHAKAIVRREDAILYVETLRPYLPGEVATWNHLGNHVIGEASERAAVRWLVDASVDSTHPPSIWEELTKHLPDIVAGPWALKLDVKGSTSGGSYRFEEDQLKRARTDAVVWCGVFPERTSGDPNFDTLPVERVTILGWSKLGEVRDAQVINGWHHLPPSTARNVSTLLDWIRTGNEPA